MGELLLWSLSGINVQRKVPDVLVKFTDKDCPWFAGSSQQFDAMRSDNRKMENKN